MNLKKAALLSQKVLKPYKTLLFTKSSKLGDLLSVKVWDRHIIPYVLLIAGLDGIVTFVIPSPGQDTVDS